MTEHLAALCEGAGYRAYSILDALIRELRTQDHIRGTDPRNIAWADEAADKLAALLNGNRTLLDQYHAQGDFTMGGALTNAPFFEIKEALTNDG